MPAAGTATRENTGVMMIGGQIYPLHLAISRNWKVHYFTSDMADKPDHRLEEARFLGICRRYLATRRWRRLKRIQDALGLDYAGIDFGLAPMAICCCSKPTPPW